MSNMPTIQVKNYPMKTHCLLMRNQYHTTAWLDAKATKLGLLVEIPELGGRWEIIEIYPYRLTDKQLKTRRTLIVDATIQSTPPHMRRSFVDQPAVI